MSRRSLWRYGAWGPPTPTPSSISMPHHLSDSRIYSSAPGTKRCESVSSIRRIIVPPCDARTGSYKAPYVRRRYATRPVAGCEAHPDRSFHISLLFVDFLFIVMFGFGRLATGRILRRRTPSGRFAQSRRHGPQRTHHPHYEAPDTTRQTASFLKATAARSRTKNIRSVHREVSTRAIFARFPIPFT